MPNHNDSPVANHGRYLHVDLTSASGKFVTLPPEVSRRFLGGAGLGTYLQLSVANPKVDPFDRESAITFVFSPLVGSPLTTSAKFAVVSKSPLTNRLNDSLCSSGFAIAGKKCGCDAIVITGRAIEHSILVVDDGRVSLESAADLWSRSTSETQSLLTERFGAGFDFAVIGPAGENRVRYATLSHDGRHAGRGGSGAILGAKNLKAIAVRGTQRVNWAHPEALIQLSKRLSRESLGTATSKYREFGTAANLLTFNRLNALPTRNFREARFEGAEDIAPESLELAREKTRAYCASCTIGCEHIYSLGDDSQSSGDGVRIEYENLFALGPLCGIRDPTVVLQASQLCDELGLDTISTGGTLAFAMECCERGLWTGAELSFGDGASFLDAIGMIASRTDWGDDLAEGSRRFAEKIGHNSITFAPQVKGLEIPGYEPRSLQTMALGFAVGTRGADHNRSGAYEADFSAQVNRLSPGDHAAQLAVETEDRAVIMDSMIICKFLRGVFQEFFEDAAEMLHLTTGWDVDAAELRVTAQRIIAAKKQFNILAGWTPAEDRLPDRFHQEALPQTGAQLTFERLQELKILYYRARGWTDDGYLPASKWQELGT